MEYNVLVYDTNLHKVVNYNIFNNSRFCDTIKSLNKEKLDDTEYSKRIKETLMCCFWCKYEYEILVGDMLLTDINKAERIDAYIQCCANLDIICDLCRQYN